MNNKLDQFAPRAGVVWQLNEKTAIRGGWGVFFDTPQLFFNTRFANNPPWGAQITLTSPAGGFADPYLAYPGGNPFPALADRLADAAVPDRRRLRQHAARHPADVAAAVERRRCSTRSATGC